MIDRVFARYDLQFLIIRNRVLIPVLLNRVQRRDGLPVLAQERVVIVESLVLVQAFLPIRYGLQFEYPLVRRRLVDNTLLDILAHLLLLEHQLLYIGAEHNSTGSYAFARLLDCLDRIRKIPMYSVEPHVLLLLYVR